MNTLKINNNKVKMVAHRGVSGLETENTNSAFVAAGNRSYYGVECDVHVTADKKFVIIHDATTNRVSDADINVETSSLELIRRIVLNKGTSGMRGDLIIPTLSEYVSICKKYDKKCVLEIKDYFTEEDLIALVNEIKEMEYLENVIFISFVFDNMVNLRKMLPDQQLQFLVRDYDNSVLEKLNQYNLDLDIRFTSLTKDIVNEVHQNNHLVNCWTCNTIEEAQQLIDFGVDFITTNILE